MTKPTAPRCKTTKKLMYYMEKDAWLHGLDMFVKIGWDNGGVYVCPHCLHYHLSNKIKSIVPQWVIDEMKKP